LSYLLKENGTFLRILMCLFSKVEKMKKSCRIKDLKHKLYLERFHPQEDGVGGYFPFWEKVAELWGSITPLSSGRFSGSFSLLPPEKLSCSYKILFRGEHMSEILLLSQPFFLRFLWEEKILTPLCLPTLDLSGRWIGVIVTSGGAGSENPTLLTS
jgi:hypothetical protein